MVEIVISPFEMIRDSEQNFSANRINSREVYRVNFRDCHRSTHMLSLGSYDFYNRRRYCGPTWKSGLSSAYYLHSLQNNGNTLSYDPDGPGPLARRSIAYHGENRHSCRQRRKWWPEHAGARPRHRRAPRRRTGRNWW